MLDDESWYSVTPEAIADHIADRVVANHHLLVVQQLSASYAKGNNSCGSPDGSCGNSSSCSISSRNNNNGRPITILDAFSGVGGNAVAFAKRPEVGLVVCVDTDIGKLRMAANNCCIYGIPPEKVVFVHADACRVLQRYYHGKISTKGGGGDKNGEDAPGGEVAGVLGSTCDPTRPAVRVSGYAVGGLELLPPRVDAVFLSPPWGGPDYERKKSGNNNSSKNAQKKQQKDEGYDLKRIQLDCGVDGEDLLKLASDSLPTNRKNIAYFLPRNLNGIKLAQSAIRAGLGDRTSNCTMELEQNVLNYKLKTITTYITSAPLRNKAN